MIYNIIVKKIMSILLKLIIWCKNQKMGHLRLIASLLIIRAYIILWRKIWTKNWVRRIREMIKY